MSMLDQLIEMGFDRAKAENALRKTNEVGLEEAMNYLLEHDNENGEDDDDVTILSATVKNNDNATKQQSSSSPELQSSSVVQLLDDDEVAPTAEPSSQQYQHQQDTATGDTSTPSSTEPQSFKCLICNKMLADADKMSMHAEITKHDQYEQSTEQVKPLTEEEKKQRLEAIQAKLKEARVQKELKEKQEAIEKEVKRRREGQSMADAEEERKQLEIRKWAEQKKREKIETELARRRILEQIKMDREARRAADNPSKISATTPPKDQPQSQSSSLNPVTSATHTRLQIRLPDGSLIRETFEAKEALAAVRCWAQMKGIKQGVFRGEIELISPFPRKVFSHDDYAKPLRELGLVPSASLIAQPVHSAQGDEYQ